MAVTSAGKSTLAKENYRKYEFSHIETNNAKIGKKTYFL